MTGKYECAFSPCRTWRYELWVRFIPLLTRHAVMFIGLNPSTADEQQLDPTVRRCAGFARRWGFDSVVMTNLFAFRATDQKAMRAAPDSIGPENDERLVKVWMVVCAWGNIGSYLGRAREVEKLLAGAGVRLNCIRKTRAGFPEHPLYLPAALRPKSYVVRS